MKKIPIVIDVDTGTDDAICITAALLNQQLLDIQAFTTVCGNVSVDKTSVNTLNLVRYLGGSQPVSVGAERPLVVELKNAVSHGQTGLGDVVLPSADASFYPKPSYEVIWEQAVANAGSLELLAVGPLTNLALAIQEYPQITGMIRKITIMGGGLYGGNMTMTSEFNIYNDPDAAKIVFESGIPITMVGLDVTLKPKLPDWVFEAVSQGNSNFTVVVTKILDFMRRRKFEIGGDDPNLHDVIALCAIVRPDILTFREFYMTVETQGTISRGMTIADFNNVENKKPNVRAAVDIDIQAFWEWFVELLTHEN